MMSIMAMRMAALAFGKGNNDSAVLVANLFPILDSGNDHDEEENDDDDNKNTQDKAATMSKVLFELDIVQSLTICGCCHTTHAKECGKFDSNPFFAMQSWRTAMKIKPHIHSSLSS